MRAYDAAETHEPCSETTKESRSRQSFCALVLLYFFDKENSNFQSQNGTAESLTGYSCLGYNLATQNGF